MNNKPLILGVAGGSGSGKTTVVSKIINGIGSENILLIQHDSYYCYVKQKVTGET
ncbi:MAG: zeta toxin family protein [Balneolaceae bacterium]